MGMIHRKKVNIKMATKQSFQLFQINVQIFSEAQLSFRSFRHWTDPASYAENMWHNKKKRMFPINLKFNRPPVPVLWHQTEIIEAFVAESLVTFGQVMTKKGTFHLSRCDLQGMSLWFPYPETMREPPTHRQQNAVKIKVIFFFRGQYKKGHFQLWTHS